MPLCWCLVVVTLIVLEAHFVLKSGPRYLVYKGMWALDSHTILSWYLISKAWNGKIVYIQKAVNVTVHIICQPHSNGPFSLAAQLASPSRLRPCFFFSSGTQLNSFKVLSYWKLTLNKINLLLKSVLFKHFKPLFRKRGNFYDSFLV